MILNIDHFKYLIWLWEKMFQIKIDTCRAHIDYVK